MASYESAAVKAAVKHPREEIFQLTLLGKEIDNNGRKRLQIKALQVKCLQKSVYFVHILFMNEHFASASCGISRFGCPGSVHLLQGYRCRLSGLSGGLQANVGCNLDVRAKLCD